jgi:hypothetical protein
VECVLLPIVNESMRVIAEVSSRLCLRLPVLPVSRTPRFQGHVIRASDVDICSILGYGFPAHKGGVHFWGSQIYSGGLKQARAALALAL